MTNKTILNEGLDYHDLEGQMIPTVTVDEYAAHMGNDSEIVTLAFTIKSEAAGNDLVDWFERGYDFVLDAQVSEGEVKPGQYLVFVEMNRRRSVPKRIIELLDDLETLTAIPAKDWTIIVDEEEHSPEEEVLKQVITQDEWKQVSVAIKFVYTKDNYFSELKEIEIMNSKVSAYQALLGVGAVGKYYSRGLYRL